MRWLALIAMLWTTAVWAVEPHEMLDDPVLEERARALSAGLRCPVCQNESIDESSAQLAAELRLVVRDRLTAGDTDQEVVDYLVARYGEFVLLKPTTEGANLILWLAAPALLLIALGIGWRVVRRTPVKADDGLSDDEKAALDKILRS
jgi:cytochrome c-type biogenesis protein CcmH